MQDCIDLQYGKHPEDQPKLLRESAVGHGAGVVKRRPGRPPVEEPKEQITLRLDAAVIASLRGRPKYNAFVNELLKAALA